MSYIALKTFTDDAILEEVVHRLKRRFCERNGVEFKFGRFEFVFHEGRFQGIEEKPCFRSYYKPSKSGCAAGPNSSDTEGGAS